MSRRRRPPVLIFAFGDSPIAALIAKIIPLPDSMARCPCYFFNGLHRDRCRLGARHPEPPAAPEVAEGLSRAMQLIFDSGRPRVHPTPTFVAALERPGDWSFDGEVGCRPDLDLATLQASFRADRFTVLAPDARFFDPVMAMSGLLRGPLTLTAAEGWATVRAFIDGEMGPPAPILSDARTLPPPDEAVADWLAALPLTDEGAAARDALVAGW